MPSNWKRATVHTHECRHCHTPVDCEGELERNHDGEPPIICTSYHLPCGVTKFLLCESCATAMKASA